MTLMDCFVFLHWSHIAVRKAGAAAFCAVFDEDVPDVTADCVPLINSFSRKVTIHRPGLYLTLSCLRAGTMQLSAIYRPAVNSNHERINGKITVSCAACLQ